MSVYASELTALQSSSLSMGSASMQNADMMLGNMGNMGASINGAEAARFQEIIRGAVPAGQVDHAVQQQIDRLRKAMKVGSVEDHKAVDISMGEKIVAGFQDLGSNLDSNMNGLVDTVHSMNGDGGFDFRDIIEMQVHVAMFSIEMELTNNIVHKSGQHLDTFLRSQ